MVSDPAPLEAPPVDEEGEEKGEKKAKKEKKEKARTRCESTSLPFAPSTDTGPLRCWCVAEREV
jgi:hypothetical protein